MIYFRSTIIAKDAHIAELQARLAASEAERALLLDRLLQRNGYAPVVESEKPVVSKSALQVISPPGVAMPEIQDAMRDVWIQEEREYLINTLGYDADRAQYRAEAAYQEQYGIPN